MKSFVDFLKLISSVRIYEQKTKILFVEFYWLRAENSRSDDVEIDLICKKISFSLTTLELLEMDTFILEITRVTLGQNHFYKLKALPDELS